MTYKPVKCELKCILRDVNKETTEIKELISSMSFKDVTDLSDLTEIPVSDWLQLGGVFVGVMIVMLGLSYIISQFWLLQVALILGACALGIYIFAYYIYTVHQRCLRYNQKDMRNCLKKMGEVGLITSNHGLFIAVQTDTSQSIKASQSLSRVQNTSKLENGKSEINSTHDDLQSQPDPLTIQAGIDQGTSSPPKSDTNHIKCPESGEVLDSSSPTPSFKNVDGYITHHCFVPLTMDQIMSRLYPQYSKQFLFNAVCRMTNEGGLRRFSEQGVMKWTVAVKADKELDVGV